MRKIYLLLTLCSFGWMVSCNDKENGTEGFDPERDIVVDRGEAPGEEYTVENGVKYVDVFYYIPRGMAPVEDWHWRLSGITGHIQDFFAGNLKRYYQIDKKFELIRNTVNPKYVKIHLLQGNVSLSADRPLDEEEYTVWLEQKRKEMGADIEAFWQMYPAEKVGHHHLVFLPGGRVGGILKPTGKKGERNDFIAFMPYDTPDFDIKYFGYDNLREKYLRDLSAVLLMAGKAFGLDDNWAYDYQDFYTLTIQNYVYDPDRTRLTAGDAQILAQSEAFNPRSQQVKYDVYPERAQLCIRDMEMEASATSITMICEFSSELPVVQVFAYEDPWKSTLYDEFTPELDMARGETTDLSVIFPADNLEKLGKEEGKNLYRAQIRVPFSYIKDYSRNPVGTMEYAKSEFRLKFLLENGYVFPQKDTIFYSNPMVYPDRLRYQYYWLPGIEAGTFKPLLLTDLRQHENEAMYSSERFEANSNVLLDGYLSTSWTGSLKDGKKPEIEVDLKGEYVVDGIRIWAPGKTSPLRVSVYVQYGELEKLVVDNRLIPGSEDMFKYIDFDRVDNASRIRMRIESGEESEVKIAELQVYRKRD